MNKLRVAAAATVIALLAAFASMGQATAATSGVGTTETSTSLVDVALGTSGSILHLRVLGDDAKATVDPGVGPTSAYSQMFALKVNSGLVPALNNLTIPNPAFESRTPGGNANVTGPAINLGTAIPVLGPAIASGSLVPLNLTSGIANGVATSGLSAKLASVGLVGGLISADTVESSMGAAAGASTADGKRLIDVNGVSVLNLGALLKGLGIDLANLPIGAVSSILSQLSTSVAGVPAGSTLGAFVTTLNTTITGLTTQIAGGGSTFGDLTGGLTGTLNGLGLPVAGGAATIPDIAALNTVLTQVTTLLDGLLGTALNVLDDLTLLKFNGLKVGTVTKAVSATGDSKAEAIGELGSISLGGLPLLNGLDLSSTLATVTNTVNTVQTTLDGVLGSISPDLAGLISVKFFDKASNNGVSASGGYTRSLAGITGASVAIKPPANLTAIVDGLLPTSGIGSLFSTPNAVPVVGSLMGTVNAIPQLSGVLGALAGGASIKVASVATGSNFTAPGAVATPAGVSQLPRTGANTTLFLVLGMLMIGGALVGRRFIPARVKSDS